MYPVARLFWQMWKHRKDSPLGPTDTHISHHICWPWDIDLWWELNNGRTLTLYDLGRMSLAMRMGMVKHLQKRRWAMAVVGGSTRYRRRVRVFEKIEMRSRGIGWDEKFFYTEQTMWKKNGECASHVLLRAAVTSRKGIIPPAQLLTELGLEATSPALPAWVQAWADADALRPWPPMQNID